MCPPVREPVRLTPNEAMQLAITGAKKGAGFVSPNPLVGCVILDHEMNLIGQGYHARVGEGHAEVQALQSVAESRLLKGAHFYVTLEPCAFEGRTPSCAKTLAKLPIASVTYGLLDPHPKVSGKGAEILRQAGIAVHQFAELQSELEELAEIFLTNMREKRPFVALKVAASLDGKIALPDGRSQWLTGEKARENVHYLRGCYDALVTGSGTVLFDNPRLNSRDPRFASKASKVVVLDPGGRCLEKLAGSALLQVRAPEDVIVVTAINGNAKTKANAKAAVPVRILQLPLAGAEFSLRDLGAALFAENLSSLFVEAGAVTCATFLKQRQVDRLYLYLGAKIIGAGLSWTTGLETLALGQALQLERTRMEPLGGDDYLVTGRIVTP